MANHTIKHRNKNQIKLKMEVLNCKQIQNGKNLKFKKKCKITKKNMQKFHQFKSERKKQQQQRNQLTANKQEKNVNYQIQQTTKNNQRKRVVKGFPFIL